MKTIFELALIFGGMIFIGFVYNLQLPKKEKIVIVIVFSLLSIVTILLALDKPFYFWLR